MAPTLDLLSFPEAAQKGPSPRPDMEILINGPRS
jgi:hypothetical protein